MANLWSDEQKSHIRLGISGKVAKQTEAQYLSEDILSKCGRWMEGKITHLNRGGLHGMLCRTFI